MSKHGRVVLPYRNLTKKVADFVFTNLTWLDLNYMEDQLKCRRKVLLYLEEEGKSFLPYKSKNSMLLGWVLEGVMASSGYGERLLARYPGDMAKYYTNMRMAADDMEVLVLRACGSEPTREDRMRFYNAVVVAVTRYTHERATEDFVFSYYTVALNLRKTTLILQLLPAFRYRLEGAARMIDMLSREKSRDKTDDGLWVAPERGKEAPVEDELFLSDLPAGNAMLEAYRKRQIRTRVRVTK